MYPFEVWIAQAKARSRETGRPLVSLCYAQSLDGSITAQRGQPLALSGPQSSVLTHHLRAAHDAILVGVGTVLVDNPRLNVRLVSGKDPQPVILDSRLRFPLEANLLRGLPPWIATTAQADLEKAALLEGEGAFLLYLPEDSDRRVSLAALLNRLADLGVNSLMVEGGAAVITSFLAQRLVDVVVLTIAPVIVGGQTGVESLVTASSNVSQAAFPKLKEFGTARLGDDLIVWGKPTWPQESANST